MELNKKTDLGNLEVVELEKMHFLFMDVPNEVEAQKAAWPEFEGKFPSLTGRKMYGLEYGATNSYRLCSLVLEADRGQNYGFEDFVFDGGSYLRLRLKFDPPGLYEKIGPAYGFLFENYEADIDWERPTIERYKAANVLDIMVPVKD